MFYWITYKRLSSANATIKIKMLPIENANHCFTNKRYVK